MIRLLKFVAFMLGIALACGIASIIVTPNVDRDSLWHTYRALPKDSVEVVFTGTSKIHSNINPAVIAQETGVSTFDLSGSSMDLRTTYYYLLEAFKTQSPRVVGIELLMMRNANEPASDIQKRNIINMPLFGRVRTVVSLLAPREWEKWAMPIVQYHSRAAGGGAAMLTRADFAPNKMEALPNIIRGYRASDRVVPQEFDTSIVDVEEERYLDNLELLRRLVILSQNNGADVLLLNTPDAQMDKMEAYAFQILEDFIQAGVECTYLGPKDFENEIELDFANDFYDTMHLNSSGAEKYSRWIAKRLVQNYE